MRLVAIALAIALASCSGCKDKPAPAKQPPPVQPERSRPAPRPSLETADVSGPGLVAVTKLGPHVTFSKTAIEVDGETVATLGTDGWIDATRAHALVQVLEGKANSDAPVAITFDATVPYRRVGQLLDLFKRAGFRNLALLAGTDRMIPIELPDSAEINGAGLRPVVSLDGAQLRLWSASGLEGTRARPKLAMGLGAQHDFSPLTRALAEIVKRRWPDGRRAAEDQGIIIAPDGNQPAQVLLELLAAVRSDGSSELFPVLFLAGGS